MLSPFVSFSPFGRRVISAVAVGFYYIRPSGVSKYNRPDGTSFYLRP